MKTKKNEKGKKTNNQNVIQAEQLMHEQKSYSREDAYKTLEIINGWIGNMDAKISFATVYKGNIIKNLIMDCQSYTKYRPNETTGGIFVSWRRKEELPTGA